MTSSTGKLIIATHTLPNISRSKGNSNKTMKFGQLLDFNIKNIFLFWKVEVGP